MERARRIGYDLFVEESGQNGKSQESTLYFGPSENVRRVTYELKYGKSLIQFTPNLTTKDQVGQVVVRGWDAVHKKKIEATATRSQLKTRSLKAKDEQFIEQAFNQREEIIADKPIHNQAEAVQ